MKVEFCSGSTIPGLVNDCEKCMPAGIETLAPVLGRLAALEHLDLRKQHMAADGLAALLPQVGHLSHLTCLELDNNMLGQAGASELSLSLGNGCLTSLQVCSRPSSDLTAETWTCYRAPPLWFYSVHVF